MENTPLENLKPTEWGDSLAPETLEELSNGKGNDEDE